MSEATQMQSIEQTLNKTDLGHMIYEKRKFFFALLGLALLGSLGYIFWKQSSQSTALNNSVKVYEFQSKVWSEAKAGKLPPAELTKSFQDLGSNVQGAPIMLPLVLEMGKFLFEKEAYADADTILATTGSLTQHPVSLFFINSQRAVVLEKLGKTDEAISLLEKLAGQKESLMAPRVSIELGRLYLSKGEKAKAQTQFDYVLNTFPNDEQAKLAKLYLGKLAE